MWEEIEKRFYEADIRLKKLVKSKKLREIIQNKAKDDQRRCIEDMYLYKEYFETLNELSINVAKKFKEKYGSQIGKFVFSLSQLKGLDELLARAVGEQELGGDAIYYKGYYLFDASSTIYGIWRMLRKKGYPYTSDYLFSEKTNKIRKISEKIFELKS